MADPVNPQETKEKIAKESAKLFLTQMASVPADVQLMAVGMLAQTIFINDIKPQRRLELLDMWTKSVRDEIKKSLQKRK